jgi:hypothetical protein
MGDQREAKKSGQGDERAVSARSDGGAAAVGPARHRALRDLQRSAGNAAVAGIVQRFDWRDVYDPMGVTTIMGGIAGLVRSGVTDQAQFKRDVYAARERPVWRAEWDAWGHAVCGACAAGFGGSGHAWAAGDGMEGVSEGLRVLGIREHDSFREDRYNQAVGRAIGRRMSGASADELVRACTQAYLGAQMLVGPAREGAWMPFLGESEFAEARRHEDTYWVPARAGTVSMDPQNWVEAVDPGERGQPRGTGRHPASPLPGS